MSNQNIEFTKEDLEKVAMLSRLNIQESEKEKFLEQIKGILEYVGQVSDMASDDIESSGGNNYADKFENSINKNITRKDEILNNAEYYTEKILNDAPQVEGKFIKVSQVLDKHKK
jgi:aspartyl-tRNA(Asn)/glutamyl-tRNA(Gln) amidotransferase subunit C